MWPMLPTNLRTLGQCLYAGWDVYMKWIIQRALPSYLFGWVATDMRQKTNVPDGHWHTWVREMRVLFFLNTVYTVNGWITAKEEKWKKHRVIKDIAPTASSLCTYSRAIRWPLAHMPRCYPLPPPLPPSKETHRIWAIPTSGLGRGWGIPEPWTRAPGPD